MRSPLRVVLPLVLVLAGMAVAAPAAQAARAAKLFGYDQLVPNGSPVRLRFKVERDNLIRWDLRGVRVEFRAGSTLLGTAVSANDGYADLVVRASAQPGDVVVTGRIAPGQRYAGPEASLLVAVRDPASRVIITDIDWTICSGGMVDVVTKPDRDVKPVRGSVQALNDIAADATIVYITARDDYWGPRTKSWLGHWGFPRGPVFFSDDIRVALGSPRPYKSATIRFLKGLFPDMPSGFGDKTTDADAYQDNALTSYIFDTHNAGPYQSFALVYRDWDALRAAVRAGQRPELAWATRFR